MSSVKSSEGSNRFANLLQPLRDLADNWNIDIARELEQYIDLLEDATFSVGDGPQKLNFAEAALVIQGSAFVYSKKVEYLYNLVFQALEYITTRKKHEDSASGASAHGPSNRSTKNVFAIDDEMKPLDTVIEMSTAIDINNERSPGEKEQLITCAPIPAALRPTISVVPSNNSSSGDSKSNTCGGDLQMGHCSVLRNGALLLPSTQNTSDNWFAVKLPETPARRPSVHSESVIACEEDDDSIQLPFTVDIPDMPGDADDDHDEVGNAASSAMADGEAVPSTPPNGTSGGSESPLPDMPMPWASSSTMTLRERRKSRTLTVRDDDPLNSIVLEQWELLDPHEMPEVPMRPFRRGKTYRIPKDLSDPNDISSSDKQRIPGGPQRRQQEGNGPFVRIRAPFFEEFDDLYDAEMRRRRFELNTLRREQQKRDRAAGSHESMRSLAAAAIASTVACNAASAALPATEDSFFDDPYAMMREDVGELDVANINDGSDDDNLGAGDDYWAQQLDNLDDDNSSLGALDIPFIPTGDAVADRYQAEMRLVQRINDWHTRLEPILEVQEGRRGFDVQEYSVELLDKIRSVEETEKRKNVAEFSQMVEGKESWEVCRYFLSSLLLTNYGNLEVVSRDPLVFKVKSTVPNFDAANALQRAEEQKEQQSEKHNGEHNEQEQEETTKTQQHGNKGKKRGRKQR